MKEEEPDDNDIAHKDASSLLVFEITFDEGNQFN
jgi:hypothetical protein